MKEETSSLFNYNFSSQEATFTGLLSALQQALRQG